MDRKDIEDFLRRSNSICDQTSAELSAVNVRRMSLKEFTGLDDRKEEMSDLSVPAWKCSPSPSSLISSFSARRRSLLSTEIPESPSKKLPVPTEESIDLPTAIQRVSELQSRLQETHTSSNAASNCTGLCNDRQNLLEESKRMAAAARELSLTSQTSPDFKWSLAIAEITDCADCLTAAAQNAICSTGVYHSELLNTEVTQVLKALHEALCAAEECKKNESLALKTMAKLQSAANQLLYAISTTTSTT